MTNIRALLILVLVLLPSCSTPWVYIKQAEPNPFVGEARFEVAPLAFRLAKEPEMDDEARASFTADKTAMAELFQKTVTESGGDRFKGAANAPFRLEPVVEHILLGGMGFGNSATVVRLRIRILREPHEVLDEVTVVVAEAPPGSGSTSGAGGLLGIFIEKTVGLAVDAASGKSFSSGGRLRNCAEALGDHVQEYLNARCSGTKFELTPPKESVN